jgi:hypothetical protein
VFVHFEDMTRQITSLTRFESRYDQKIFGMHVIRTWSSGDFEDPEHCGFPDLRIRI